MKPLVIFGLGEHAELAHFYFQHDTERKVAAFAADAAYIQEESWHGLPVVAFETLRESFPPEAFDVFVAVGFSQVNALRRDRYMAAKAMGYALPSYVSSKATLWSLDMGENCFILEDNTIQPFVKIGHNVTLWSGNHIGHHSVIGDHCFVTSQVVVSGKVTVGEGCFIGVNATLRDHITVGRYCVIGAGALIMRDTQDREVYAAQGTAASGVASDKLKNF